MNAVGDVAVTSVTPVSMVSGAATSAKTVGPDLARRIVTDRYVRGVLTSVDELVTRNLLPRQVARGLDDTVVALPPA